MPPAPTRAPSPTSPTGATGPPPPGSDWATPPPPDGSRTGITVAAAIAIVALLGVAGVLLAVDASTVQRSDTFPDVDAVTLDLDNADVTLVTGEQAAVSAEVRTGRLGGQARAEVSDGTLRIAYDCPRFNGLWFGLGCDGEYQLTVPPGVEVTGQTGNGDLRLTDLDGRIDLATSNGEVHLDGTGGPTVVHTSNGEITGIDLESSDLDATTSNGGIALAFTTTPDRVRASTSNGRVEVTVPDDGTAYAVDPVTSNGDVATDVPNDPSSSRRLELRTSNGDVVVRTGR